MKKFSEKTQLTVSLLAFLGFTFIGLNLIMSIIGFCLFIPLAFVQSNNFMVEKKLSIFKFADSMKFVKAVIKGQV